MNTPESMESGVRYQGFVPEEQPENTLRNRSLPGDTPSNSEQALENNPFGFYLRGIARYPRLTPEDEIDLGKKMEASREAQERVTLAGAAGQTPQGGDLRLARQHKQLRDHFTTSNLGLVVVIAKRFPTFAGWDLLDSVQEGNLGLLRAVEQYDWRKGVKGIPFHAQAGFTIRTFIARGIVTKGTTIGLAIDRGRRLVAAARRADRGEGELSQEDERLLGMVSNLYSLEWPSDDGTPVSEFRDYLIDSSPGPDEVAASNDRQERVRRALEILKPRARKLIKQYFALDAPEGEGEGGGETYVKLGAEQDVTGVAIRLAVRRALKELSQHEGIN